MKVVAIITFVLAAIACSSCNASVLSTSTASTHSKANKGLSTPQPLSVHESVVVGKQTAWTSAAVSAKTNVVDDVIANPLAIRGGLSSTLKHTIKVGIYFGLWYALNIGYNIHNKRVLNALPLPYTLALAQLFMGIPLCFLLWITKARKAPKLNLDNVKNLSPVALMHMLAHLSAVISLGAGAVSFTHIVKAGEPIFTALFSAIFFKQYFHPMVYATLLPVVAGVGLASMKELSFSWVALGGAMMSNVASAARGIFAKATMSKPTGENMNASNLYAVLTILSCLMLMPISLGMEAPSIEHMWDKAVASGTTPQMLTTGIVLSGLFYYLYNEVAFLCLDQVHPITHAVGNTIKRVVIIVVSVLVFKTELTPLAILGSGMAVGGVLLYSLAKDYYAKKESLANKPKKPLVKIVPAKVEAPKSAGKRK